MRFRSFIVFFSLVIGSALSPLIAISAFAGECRMLAKFEAELPVAYRALMDAQAKNMQQPQYGKIVDRYSALSDAKNFCQHPQRHGGREACEDWNPGERVDPPIKHQFAGRVCEYRLDKHELEREARERRRM